MGNVGENKSSDTKTTQGDINTGDIEDSKVAAGHKSQVIAPAGDLVQGDKRVIQQQLSPHPVEVELTTEETWKLFGVIPILTKTIKSTIKTIYSVAPLAATLLLALIVISVVLLLTYPFIGT